MSMQVNSFQHKIGMGRPQMRPDGIKRPPDEKSIGAQGARKHDRAEFGSKKTVSEDKTLESTPKESTPKEEAEQIEYKTKKRLHTPHRGIYNQDGTMGLGSDKIREVKSGMKGNIDAFRKMVEAHVSSQAKHAGKAGDNTLKGMLKGIMGNSPEQAQSAISEDGEWGAKKTAERILNFAIALSGGDPEKISILKNAVLKGFAAAEKVWGGSLPGISYETKAKIMAGFDEWERTGSAQAAQEFISA